MKDARTYVAKWIIAFVRPWDAEFFRELAEMLAAECEKRKLPRPRIRYLTFWNETRKRLDKQSSSGAEVVFLPDRLKQMRLDQETRTILARRERELLQCGMTPLKTMMECERHAPKDGLKAEDFMWRVFAVLDELVPNGAVLLSNQPDHVCYWLACDLCNVKGGRYFGFCLAGRPSGYTQVLKNASEPWDLREPGPEHYEVVDEQIEEIENGVLPSYMVKRNPYPTISDKARLVLSLIGEAKSGNYFRTWRSIGTPGLRKAREAKWKVLGSGVRHWTLDELDRPFVYFPLHLEPEASTSVWAPFFKYQAVVLEWLAKSLPAGVDLVIKENPKMWGERSRRFYRHTARLPGVRWIDPTTSSRDLTIRSAAVVTITGTVAIEAMALAKPVGILGTPPYSYVMESIPRFTKPEQLADGLRMLLKATVDRAVFREEYARYVANLVDKPFNDAIRKEDSPYPGYVLHEQHLSYVVESLLFFGVSEHAASGSIRDIEGNNKNAADPES